MTVCRPLPRVATTRSHARTPPIGPVSKATIHSSSSSSSCVQQRLLVVGGLLVVLLTTEKNPTAERLTVMGATTVVSPRSISIEGGAVTVCLGSTGSGGSNAVVPSSPSSRGHICGLYHGDGDGNDVLYFNANAKFSANFSASRIINATCAVCQLPPVIVAGSVHLALGVPNPTGVTDWSVGTRIAFFDPVEVAFGLRPYISESFGSLLLAPHFSMAEAISFEVELLLPFASPSARTHQWKDLNASQAEHILTFALDGLPSIINQDCRIIVRFANGGATIERLRRLQRAPPLPASSTVLPVQVDHSRRSLLLDGRIWRGIGFYMAGFGQGGYWWGFQDLSDLVLRGLAPHGVNQGMLYNFQYFPIEVQLKFLDRAAAVGFKVMLQV